VDGATSVAGTVNLFYPTSGGALPGFPKANTQGAGAGAYSTSGTEIISVSGAYNGDPIYAFISCTIVSGSGYGFTRSEVNISSITETAGGDTYLRGTPIGKSIEIIQTP